jgi:hypothetical protein
MKRNILMLVAVGLLQGCTFFSPQKEYTFTLPPLSEEYIFITSWLVEVVSERGQESTFYLSSSSSSFALTASREEAYLILAYPLGSGGVRLKPSGLYWEGSSSDEKELSFELGPAVLALRLAQCSGYDIRGFNCTRLIFEWEKKSLDSPWFIDVVKIAESLVLGSFRVTHLAVEDLFSLEAFDEEGWVSEDPFIGSSYPLMLPVGSYRFYNSKEGLVREISLDEEGYELSFVFSVKEL